MSKIKKFAVYKCPHNKRKVIGRYCKNNCSLYKNNKCIKFKK